ncbi:hypothetical protein KJ996_03760 [Patescibacteria group bacterium]|nr:hypothetical protein [Patescibacteria group bacterium]
MVHFSEIESLRVSMQFLAFSEAYLYSAACLCDVLALSPEESSFPRGAVVLSLSFHGIELFLKAAILEKVPTHQFGGKAGHDLELLGKKYEKLYPRKQFTFEIPFRTEEIALVNPDPRVIEELNLKITEHKRTNPTDQLYRYPRDIAGKKWVGFYAFEPKLFAANIAKVQRDVNRVKELIFHD